MSDKFIDWKKDENGLEVGKFTVESVDDLERWQECYDKINELERRLRELEDS